MHEIKLKKRRGSLLLRGAVICLALFFSFLITTQQIQISEKKKNLEKIRTEMQIQTAKNDKLKTSLEKDDDFKEYAERAARDEYNYAKPNERIYINIGEGE